MYTEWCFYHVVSFKNTTLIPQAVFYDPIISQAVRAKAANFCVYI